MHSKYWMLLVLPAAAIGHAAGSAAYNLFHRPPAFLEPWIPTSAAEQLARRFRKHDSAWEEFKRQKMAQATRKAAEDLYKGLPCPEVYEATNALLLDRLNNLVNYDLKDKSLTSATTKMEVREAIISVLALPEPYGLDDPRNMRVIELLMRHLNVTPDEAPTKS